MNTDSKELPDTDNVSRYCNYKKTHQGGLPTPKAFELRGGESYLSVNWLEYFKKASIDENLSEVREVLRRKGFGIRKSGRFMVLNVGAIRSELGNLVTVRHMPECDDPSHAAILGYENSQQSACLILAAMVARADVHNAVE